MIDKVRIDDDEVTRFMDFYGIFSESYRLAFNIATQFPMRQEEFDV